MSIEYTVENKSNINLLFDTYWLFGYFSPLYVQHKLIVLQSNRIFPKTTRTVVRECWTVSVKKNIYNTYYNKLNYTILGKKIILQYLNF